MTKSGSTTFIWLNSLESAEELFDHWIAISYSLRMLENLTNTPIS